MPGFRTERVADLIRDELSELLRHEVDETRNALVTITGVKLSPDLQHAKVFVSIFPEGADRDRIMDALDRSRGKLRHRMGRALRLKRIPELEFRLDTSAEHSARIDELLAQDAGRDDPESE